MSKFHQMDGVAQSPDDVQAVGGVPVTLGNICEVLLEIAQDQ